MESFLANFSSKWFNLVCAAVHIAAAITVGVVGAIDPYSEYASVNILRLFLKVNYELVNGPVGDWQYDLKYSFSVNVFVLISVFLCVTAAFHLLYSVAPVSRFIEYSITAPIMILIVAIVSGIIELYVLLALWGLCMTTMSFGYLQQNVSPTTNHAHFFGYVPYVVMWAVIVTFFCDAAFNNEVPSFVTAIVLVEIILFSSFGAVQLAYLRGENAAADGAYNLLSLTSKQLLTWICFSGIIGQKSGN